MPAHLQTPIFGILPIWRDNATQGAEFKDEVRRAKDEANKGQLNVECEIDNEEWKIEGTMVKG